MLATETLRLPDGPEHCRAGRDQRAGHAVVHAAGVVLGCAGTPTRGMGSYIGVACHDRIAILEETSEA